MTVSTGALSSSPSQLTVLINASCALLENWNDDFEFNPNSPPRKNKTFTLHSTNSDNAPLGCTSSRFAVDWDTDAGKGSPTCREKVLTAPMVEAGPMPAKHLTIIEGT
ncbi:hypothetical protein F5887DRAFT_1078204 [Amanita rubescens]|nr:hypothetical protein F5887DRAFT_1078204 [Amanita rubescens]